jgi:hypothetical protein
VTNFNSCNPIVISFPRFAGGKFISNCLALSQYTVPQDATIAKKLLENPTDYQYRFDSILATLPPDQSSMKQWIEKYEFGDQQLYGNVIDQWQNGIETTHGMNTVVKDLSLSKLRYFFCDHGGAIGAENLLKVWPNAQILMLINHTKFSAISYQLKSTDSKSPAEHSGNYCKEKYNQLAGPEWPSWEQFENTGFDTKKLIDYPDCIIKEIGSFYPWHTIKNQITLLDIDNNIFDQDRFLDVISSLYQTLGFDDFNPELVGKFWKRYIDLHQIL